MSVLNLYIVEDSRSLVLNDTNNQPFTFPPLHQNDTVPISITRLRSLNGLVAPFFEKVLVGTYSVRLGIFTAGGTLLAQIVTASFTADATANRYTGILELNTTQIGTAITGNNNTDLSNAVMEIETTETVSGAVSTIYRNVAIVIEKDYLTNATQSVATGEVAATAASVAAGYVPKFATQPSMRVLRSTNGLLFKETITDGGIIQLEPYTEV